MDRVKGKAAVVTGGANGIGEAAARILAKEGACVGILDIDDENGKRVQEGIIADGGDALYCHADITQEDEVAAAFKTFYDKWQKLHILVNNAGIAGNRIPAHKTSVEEFQRLMDVNLKGTFLCTKHAAPYILKTGPGSVINIASIYGIVASDVPAYDTSKGGMRAMTKSDAILYAKDNIRFNSIHPGNIKTPLFEKLVAQEEPAGLDHAVNMLSVTNPLNRMGTPEDIAYGVLYLASDESSYVNASELVIDGGFVNMPFPVYSTNTADWTTHNYYDKSEL